MAGNSRRRIRGLGVAIGVALLSAAVVASTSASSPRHSSGQSLPFEPGQYVGTTSQKCPPDTTGGICSPGKKLPISFTATRSGVRDLKAVVVDACEGAPAAVHVINFPRVVPLHVKAGSAIIYDRQEQPGGIAVDDGVLGQVHGQQASGALESILIVNEAGQVDHEGTVHCRARHVHWQATLR